MIGTIIGISGYDWRDQEYFNDLSIDKFILSQSIKKNKRILFVPTASGDDENYCNMFEKVYGKKLGCTTDCLLLYKRQYTLEQLVAIANKTDIIYVGGGDTKKMLTKRKQTGFDKIVTYFYVKGGIIAGISAGAMCSFTSGFGDSGDLIKGLDFVKGNFIPHFVKDNSNETITSMKKNKVKSAIGFPDYSLFYKHGNDEKIGIFKPSLDIEVFIKKGTSIIKKSITLDEGFHKATLLFD